MTKITKACQSDANFYEELKQLNQYVTEIIRMEQFICS